MFTDPNPLLIKAEWYKFCTHLRRLNLTHFKLVEVMGLKITATRSSWICDLPTIFHENLPIGSRVIIGDTQTDKLAIL
jgi:hypothetical protein